MALSNSKVQIIPRSNFLKLRQVDPGEFERHYTYPIGIQPDSAALSCDAEIIDSREIHLFSRPDYIGAPFTINGISIKTADDKNDVSPTYTNSARDCNCGVMVINTEGLHTNAVFHYAAVGLNDKLIQALIKEYPMLYNASKIFRSNINTFFFTLDNFIRKTFSKQKDSGKKVDVFVDFILAGGWSIQLSKKYKDMAEQSGILKERLEEFFENRLRKTLDLASEHNVKLKVAKSFIWGQEACLSETALHYDPRTNITSIAISDQVSHEDIDPAKTLEKFHINDLHRSS